MSMILAYKIDVKKIVKEHLFVGQKGTYLDGAFMDNKDGGVDEYGNHGFIVQGVSKEARQRDERGPIIGNWKWAKDRPQQSQQQAQATQQQRPSSDDGKPDDLPF